MHAVIKLELPREPRQWPPSWVELVLAVVFGSLLTLLAQAAWKAIR